MTGALDAISDAINAQLNALDVNDRGTVLANLTISLFVRASKRWTRIVSITFATCLKVVLIMR